MVPYKLLMCLYWFQTLFLSIDPFNATVLFLNLLKASVFTHCYTKRCNKDRCLEVQRNTKVKDETLIKWSFPNSISVQGAWIGWLWFLLTQEEACNHSQNIWDKLKSQLWNSALRERRFNFCFSKDF